MLDEGSSPAPRSRRRIRDLMVIIAVTAVVLGLARWAAPAFDRPTGPLAGACALSWIGLAVGSLVLIAQSTHGKKFEDCFSLWLFFVILLSAVVALIVWTLLALSFRC